MATAGDKACLKINGTTVIDTTNLNNPHDGGEYSGTYSMTAGASCSLMMQYETTGAGTDAAGTVLKWISASSLKEILPNQQFTPDTQTPTNGLLQEVYQADTGHTTASDWWNYVSNPANGVDPTSSSYLANTSSLTTPQNAGERIRGYFTPATTGNYSFQLAVDAGDSAQFWLSNDDTPDNIQNIVSVSGNTASSLTVALQAGQTYYMEIRYKAVGTGSLQAAWNLNGGGWNNFSANATPLLPRLR